MTPTVEKRRAFIINIIYFAIILAVFYLVFKTFFGMLFPFIVAFLVAAAVNRPVSFIERKTPLKRGIISVVTILLILGCFAGLFSLLGIQIYERLKGFYDFAMLKLQNISELFQSVKDWLISAIAFLPEKVRVMLTENITGLFDDLIDNGFANFSISNIGIDWSSLVTKGGGVIKDTVVQIPSVLVSLIISVVACVFMSTDYNNIKDFFVRQFPAAKRDKVHRAKEVALGTFKSMFKAYSLIMLITFSEICVGLFILKVCKIYDSSYIIIISALIAVIDIIPVLGTGTVLVPWAIYSFIAGDMGMGIGLLIIYAVITVIRQVVEPKFVAGQAGLSPVVTIAAMYIGTKTIGVLGFLILPFLVILIKKFNDEGIIHLFVSAENGSDQRENTPATEAISETVENIADVTEKNS